MSTDRTVKIVVDILQGATLSGNLGTGLGAAIQAAQSRGGTSAGVTSTSQQGLFSSLDKFAVRGLEYLKVIANNTAPGNSSPPPPLPPPPAGGKSPKDPGSQVGSGIAQMADAGAAAGMAWAHMMAGSPAADTLTQSVRMLSMTVGTALVPGMVRASAVIQDTARWIDALDPSTKQTIGNFASWAGVAIGTGIALNTVGVAIRPLVGLVTGAGSAITGFSAALGVSKTALLGWTVVGAGVVGAIGLMTNGFGLLGDSLDRISARAEEARMRIERLSGGGRAGRTDYESLPASMRERLQQSREGRRMATMTTMVASLRAQVGREGLGDTDRVQTELETALLARNNMELMTSGIGRRRSVIQDVLMRHGVGRADAERRAIAAVPNAGVDFRELTPNQPQYTGAISNEAITNLAREASGANRAVTLTSQIRVLEGLIAQQGHIPGNIPGATANTTGMGANRGNGGVMISQQLVPPQLFGSGTQMYESTLTEALGRTNLEQQSLDQLMSQTRQLEQINQNTGRQGAANIPQMPPRDGDDDE